MTTPGTTELLQGRARGLGKRFIAARSLTRKIRTPVWVGIALALRPRAGIGALALSDPLPVATSLRSPAAFTLFAGSITAVGCPLSPPPGSRATGRAAIAAEWVQRLEGLITTLQKTEPVAQTPRDVLNQSRFAATLRWAHGESLLPYGQVSLRRDNFAARRFYSSAALPSCGNS